MKGKEEVIIQAEQAARATITPWIRRALRESFLQAIRQTWTVQSNVTTGDPLVSPSSGNKETGDFDHIPEYKVELSSNGIDACFSFVERVSQAWQQKLKGEHHVRVAQWIVEVHQQGKPTLWAEPKVEDSEFYVRNNIPISTDEKQAQHGKKSSLNQEDLEGPSVYGEGKEDTTQHSYKASTEGIDLSTDKNSDDDVEEANSSEILAKKQPDPNAYCKLRSLGRKHQLDYTVMSVSDALQEIKEYTRNDSTYWPLNNDIIDQASLEMSHRMCARDRHGSSHIARSGGDGNIYTKKAVRFKVLPKALWETKQQQQQEKESNITSNQEVEGSDSETAEQVNTLYTKESEEKSKAATLLLATRKRNKISGRSNKSSPSTRKKAKILKEGEIPRPPSDATLSSDGDLPIVLSLEERKALDNLLMLDDDEKEDHNGSECTATIPEVTMGLFGGLQYVGQTNHMIKNPKKSIDVVFMTKENNNKITRRKERISIQERLDPNRIQVGRDENPEDRKSKLLRTRDWFDEEKKFFDFDLGWCLMEIPTPMNKKRLCAFSSMEICLGDNDK
mmetsp:Transcript_26681/g.57434  ORF Transcript_26681/g.57434 Transcript_26681/m.57434 type:complete len:561 (-) Transcript_26681:4091-5773(-)